MKRILCLIVLILSVLSLTGAAYGVEQALPGLKFVDSFENGRLYKTVGTGGDGEFGVVVLKGTWRDMGRQYGRLLKDEMNEFYGAAVDKYMMAEHGVSYEAIVDMADSFFDHQFPYAKELIEGMAEGSGFSLEKAKIMGSLVHAIDLAHGCSGLAAWGPYTGGGPLVVGRNWDMGGPYAGFRKFLCVVVYDPAGEQNGVADVNFVGTISLQTGMNESGIFLDLQNGQHSDPAIVEDRRMPTFALFDFLLNSSSLEAIEARMFDRSSLPMLGLIINAADESRDEVFEWATYDVKKRGAEGLIGSSNHFIDPSWESLPEVQPGGGGDYSLERLNNLLALGLKYKGKMDAAKMMSIFDTDYTDGGATFSEYTVYQVVAVPAKRAVWVKARGFSDWKKIDLGSLWSER